MKTNFYMNRKSSGLIAVLMVLSSALSFTAQNEVLFDQDRYDAIVKLYLAGNLNKDKVDTIYDIQVVTQHRDSLDVQLADEKTKVAALYAPGMLSVAGKGLAAVALAGGLASATGAIAASHILGRPENQERLSRRRFGGKQDIIRGATYLEMIKGGYARMLMGRPWMSVDSDVRDRIFGSVLFMTDLSFNEFNLTRLGLFAPPIAIVSLVLAGISKYLLNKSASYTREIERLNAEIARDNEIIIALRAIKK
jgi:hypothetical protein